MDNPAPLIHLRRMIDDTTGEALPFCGNHIVPKGQSTSWMNQTTCEDCRERWRTTSVIGEW